MTSGRVFKIKLPMRMKINKRGEVESLNLNVYRNLHFYHLSYQKNAFHDAMKPLLRGLPKLGKVSLSYEINPKGQGRLDTMNVGSIVDKFFSDALVESGIIVDDDYKTVVENSFRFGFVSPKDPHVLVTITEIEPRKGNPMRILLDQDEIQQALEAFVETLGISGATGVELAVNEAGEITAEVLMGAAQTSSQPKTNTSTITGGSNTPATVKRGGRPLGSKNKPKEDPDVDATLQDRNAGGGTGNAEAGTADDTGEETNREDGPEAGDKRTQSTKSEGRKGPNLFGDEEDQSSQADAGSDQTGDGAEAPAPTVKKSSIFDE